MLKLDDLKKLENLKLNLASRNIGILLVDTEQEIVLCHLPHNDVTPYVTWYFNADGDTHWGNYFQDIETAEEDFNKRRR